MRETVILSILAAAVLLLSACDKAVRVEPGNQWLRGLIFDLFADK
jgi:hypothetical protein